MSNTAVAPRRTRLWYALVTACWTVPAAFGQVQVVVDETFESPSLQANGWTIADRNSSGSPAYWAVVNSGFANLTPPQGSGMAYCAGYGYLDNWSNPRAQAYMYSVMERTVDLTGAAMADLSFDYHVRGIAQGEELAVYMDDRLIRSFTAATAVWTHYLGFVDESCGGIHTLRFVWKSAGYAPGSGAFLDNVRLTKVANYSPVVRAPAGDARFWYRRPHFQWPAIAGATWYHLWLARDGRTYQSFWMAAPDGTPTWQPPSDLPGGAYQWWLQPWGPGIGLGAWSEAATFGIEAMRPAAPPQLWPSGAQFSGEVEYGWVLDDAAHATWQHLWVGRDGGGTWHDGWYAMSGPGWASVLPGTHRGGSYQWWVRAWSADGIGDWSGPMAFTVPSDDPTPSETGYPNGINVTTPRPVFEWRRSERAEWYRLYVSRGTTTVVDYWTPNTYWNPTFDLAVGDYSWWIGAWNRTTQTTIWSARGGFGVR